MSRDSQALETWLDQQYRRSIGGLLSSVSPVSVVKRRPGFGQSIRALRGAIVASPVLADWNPQPDYFFHWFRDSALVIDAVRLLHQAGDLGAEARAHFADFVRFSLALRDLDGRRLVADRHWRASIAPDFEKFVRRDEELAAVHGAAVVADTRVNPDATLDISGWSRPQFDGAPLRALAALRWMSSVSLDHETAGAVAELVRGDLDFTLAHWHEPCFDIWEEESGLHYYTLCVSAAALAAGADWLQGGAEALRARAYGAAAAEIRERLEGYWMAEAGYFKSRILASDAPTTKELDIAVILAAIHASGDGTTHTVRDPRMHSTLARLEKLFDSSYAINRHRAADRGPAMGRYAGDRYFSGGAYYFSTLGAAEFCFLAAAHPAAASGPLSPAASAPHAAAASAWKRRGDAFLQTVRAFTPANGELSEQFDQSTGAQTSARDLAWSYAAFISCIAARRAVSA